MPFKDIRQAHERGYTETYEMADYLEVDEAFLKESLDYYQQKGCDLSEKEAVFTLLEGILTEKCD